MLRLGQVGQRVVGNLGEQIAEPTPGKSAVSLGGTSLEHPVAAASAAAIPPSKTVVLPIPASPSIRSLTGPEGNDSSWASRRASSLSRPRMLKLH